MASLFENKPSTSTQTDRPSVAAQARLDFALSLLQLFLGQGGSVDRAGLAKLLQSPQFREQLAKYKAAATAPGAQESTKTVTGKGGGGSTFQDLAMLFALGSQANSMFGRPASGGLTIDPATGQLTSTPVIPARGGLGRAYDWLTGSGGGGTTIPAAPALPMASDPVYWQPTPPPPNYVELNPSGGTGASTFPWW